MTQARKLPTIGQIYLIFAEGTALHKIGFTTQSIKKRILAIAGASPLPLRILAVKDGDRAEESRILSALAPWRAHKYSREWFRLPERAIWDLLDHFGNEDWEQLKRAHARDRFNTIFEMECCGDA